MGIYFSLVNYVFLVFFFFRKFAAILYLARNPFESMSSLLLLALISQAKILATFVSLFLIRPREAFSRVPKYVCGIVLFLLEYEAVFYLIRIYIICNFHDVSWGSRGSSEREASRKKKYFRCNLVIIVVWLLVQGLILYFFIWFPLRYQALFLLTLLLIAWNGF